MVQPTSLIKVALALLLFATVLQAADVGRAITDAESRRKGAESSLRELAAKQSPSLADAKKTYALAATLQNAWLGMVIDAVEKRAVTEPDVAVAARAATNALMDWVAVGGRALDLPPLSASMEKGLRKSVETDLLDIAKEIWRANLNTDVKKRDETIASLNTRLRWKTAEEVANP